VDHDITTALDEWVRKGAAPEKIIATQYTDNNPTKSKLRDRPLCPYPQNFVFLGGPVDDAHSYDCR
jgi:feruloyl esterase